MTPTPIPVQPRSVPRGAPSYGRDLSIARREKREEERLYAYCIPKNTSDTAYLVCIEREEDFFFPLADWKKGTLYYLSIIALTDAQLDKMRR